MHLHRLELLASDGQELSGGGRNSTAALETPATKNQNEPNKNCKQRRDVEPQPRRSPAGVGPRAVLRHAGVQQRNEAQVHPSLLPAQPRRRGPGRAGQSVLGRHSKQTTQGRTLVRIPPDGEESEADDRQQKAALAAKKTVVKLSVTRRARTVLLGW